MLYPRREMMSVDGTKRLKGAISLYLHFALLLEVGSNGMGWDGMTRREAPRIQLLTLAVGCSWGQNGETTRRAQAHPYCVTMLLVGRRQCKTTTRRADIALSSSRGVVEDAGVTEVNWRTSLV